MAAGYGLTADDWQEDVLEDWLRRRRDSRWSSAVCWLAVPRQNGKNACIEIRELYGMVELGERFLHTAHEVKTARKAFRRLLSFFDNPQKYPELAAMAKEVRKTNGQEAIFLDNGGSVEVIARSKGSGRGFDGIDVLVCDEAQELNDDEQAALLPTISAATQGNPQVIFTGTPPNPEKPMQGEVFRRVRETAAAGLDPRLCLHDFGVEDGPLPDVDDRQLWYRVNPALGGRLNIAEVERERGLMVLAKFAAERLGWWGDPAMLVTKAVVDLGLWADLAAPSSVVEGPVALAVDIPPDRSSTSIAVAWLASNARLMVAVTSMPGTRRAVETVRRKLDEYDVVDVSLHAGGPAGGILADLEAEGVEVTTVSNQEVAQATAAFIDGVANSTVGHVDQVELSDALHGAQLRTFSDGASVWDRRDPTANIAPLVAATLAAHGFTKNAPDEYDVLDSVF